MIQSWKRFIQTQANRVSTERRSPTRRVSENEIDELARRAALQWQREYWDTFMREETQVKIAIRYIESNPVKAKLCGAKKQWAFSSARFRDKFERLLIPNGPQVSSQLVEF